MSPTAGFFAVFLAALGCTGSGHTGATTRPAMGTPRRIPGSKDIVYFDPASGQVRRPETRTGKEAVLAQPLREIECPISGAMSGRLWPEWESFVIDRSGERACLHLLDAAQRFDVEVKIDLLTGKRSEHIRRVPEGCGIYTSFEISNTCTP